jgi:moderate conductance mechanosensitive channel
MVSFPVASPQTPMSATTEPEPTPTFTIDPSQTPLTGGPCGTGDATLCGVIHNLVGDIETARTVSVLLGTPLFIVAVLLVAAIVRYVLLRVIRRTVARIEAGEPSRRGRIDLFEPTDPISRERKVQRAQAIGSILKAVVSIVVWTAAVFLILPALGVNITGLVAGAGIVGIALGFGAQTLVQDFVSGLFMIAEDQYGVGDVIDMGEATGVVEAVGLRTTRLRAVDGTVWHVRNGEVVRVGNMSQGWSRAVLDISVAYGEDLTRVMETLKELGSDMRQDPDWGDKFLDEPEVWGVEALAADGITVRMIIKTVPLQQWVVAREMRRRIKYRFDTLGIEIPFPQRTVWMRTEGPGADDEDGPERSVAAATQDIPPAPQSPRGEADVAEEDAPEPGTGEPFGASEEPDRPRA